MIELRVISELIDARQVHAEQAPGSRRRYTDAVEVHVFTTVVGPQAHEITLIADHVDQLELLEERGNRRIALIDFRTRLDGNANGRSIVESETQERVSHGTWHPVGDVEVHAVQPGEEHLARFVTRCEVILASVI